tara:strand:- start:437 stop:775 length:339 start_codon:yes stop_codon:yes gene_type:complete
MSDQNLTNANVNSENIEKLPQGQAVAGMVCGIVGLLFSFCLWFIGFPLTMVGVILSAMALKKCKEGTGGGKGMAIAGLVTGIIGLVLSIIYIILIFVIWGSAAAASSAYYYY